MTDLYSGVSRKRLVGEAWFWIAMVIIAVVVIGGGVGIVRTLTASPRGQAGAYVQKEGANNRIFAQASFEQANADIEGYVVKIDLAKAAYKAHPTDVNETNVQGLQQQCINTVQQYNADARKYLLRDFRAADLPTRQDPQQCR